MAAVFTARRCRSCVAEHEGVPMAAIDAVSVVGRYYAEVLNGRNVALLDELFSPDFVGYSASFGTYTLADMRRDIGAEFTGMPEDETQIVEQLACGDYVVTYWRYRWRHDQPLFDELPSGRWLTMDGVHIDRVIDGRIVERREIKDFWSVVAQLGGTPTFSTREVI
jgi:predicted ester cyclase